MTIDEAKEALLEESPPTEDEMLDAKILGKIMELYENNPTDILLLLSASEMAGHDTLWKLLRRIASYDDDNLIQMTCDSHLQACANEIRKTKEIALLTNTKNGIMLHVSMKPILLGGSLALRGIFLLTEANRQIISSSFTSAANSIAIFSGIGFVFEAALIFGFYWCNKINKKETYRMLFTALGTNTGAIAGVYAGAAIGSIVGPIGAVVGGVIGGTISALASNTFASWLSCIIFDLSPSEAVNDAYKAIGKTPRASEEEIKEAYLAKRLAINSKPNAANHTIEEELTRLETQMAIIIADRTADKPKAITNGQDSQLAIKSDQDNQLEITDE